MRNIFSCICLLEQIVKHVWKQSIWRRGWLHWQTPQTHAREQLTDLGRVWTTSAGPTSRPQSKWSCSHPPATRADRTGRSGSAVRFATMATGLNTNMLWHDNATFKDKYITTRTFRNSPAKFPSTKHVAGARGWQNLRHLRLRGLELLYSHSGSDNDGNSQQTTIQGCPFLGQISAIWPRFTLAGLKNSFGLRLFFGYFTLKKFALKENINFPFFR